MGSETESSSQFEVYNEYGITVLADTKASCPRKSPLYLSKELSFVRNLVCNILKLIVQNRGSECNLKCIDVLSGTGISGILWKKLLGNNVEVKINNPNELAIDFILRNVANNSVTVEVTNKDPCIVLHERGYNFIYLNCTNDAANYFDAALRNISRDGVLVITAKDDCAFHGNNPDVALRRYGGRITRAQYYQELGIRLIITALARTAAKFNKAISVLCCVSYINTVTITVKVQKGPLLANKMLENIRLLKHCMVCQNRKFFPQHDGFTQDPNEVKLDCSCANKAPGKTNLELGPVWSGLIFDVSFVERLQANFKQSEQHVFSNYELSTTFDLILEEARCPTVESSEEPTFKKTKYDFLQPPFYFNIHKHHPQINQLMKLNKVVDRLRSMGYRASKTHFDKLAIRTDAPLSSLFEIMSSFDYNNLQ
ncbi:TRMT1-like protein [Halyomorpha halys]|uniref:TRMT1-like protein n=1 Tax=Halyomorpha halys TaxID=286706 RepID=UPI0006D4D7AC|nr:TRMT1-like protein [Halyomorpha halys]